MDNRRRLIRHGPALVDILHAQLPHQVIAENGLVGGVQDAHQAEASIQQLIVKLFAPHIPSPELIRNNRKGSTAPTISGFIPDIIIDRIGGSPWVFFELKTLLAEDQLKEGTVAHDLEKLCAYKQAHPDAAAVFVLVGERRRLSQQHAKKLWEKAGISADESFFGTARPRLQRLPGGEFIAIPCGWSGKQNPVMTLTWEIQPINTLRAQSSTYDFLACMAGG